MNDQRSRQSRRTRPNLAERIASELRERIATGGLQPGDRLQTEHELAQAHGVSRAVVREAIAALRSDGLVVVRQGSGAFVSDGPSARQRHSLLSFDTEKLSAIIEVLELRAAVESEAAALAAERRSPAELAKIMERHAAVAEAVAAGEQAEAQDFAFHLAIAESTHNRHFVEFFRFLGASTIPRAQIGQGSDQSENSGAYLEGLHAEHSEILDAIAARDPMRAHTAMRAHLQRSQERYQALATKPAMIISK